MNSLGTGTIGEIITGVWWWAFALLSSISLVIVLTGCVQQPLASYRDPQTGRLCWARLDADEMRCTMPSRTP